MDTMTSLRNHSDPIIAHPPSQQLEEDTQEVVGFLLALKHRSVTPDPECEPNHVSEKPKKRKVPVVRTKASGQEDKEETECPEIDLDTVLRGSKLVHLQDRGLVPDVLLVAMAQMKPCHLTHADRIGCYKTREIGFVGLCCKHCGGQPGFGKYFPGTVRSLAQTTTSQTMIKHVSSKCRLCPANIRQAVNELQRIQNIHESTSGRPRYGARKVFFERIWTRLHLQPLSDASETESTEEEDEHQSVFFGKLPTKRNLKRQMMELDTSNKRSRVSHEIANWGDWEN